MQTQQKSISEGNFYFLKHSISVSQSIVDTIGKIKLIGKIMLYVISHGKLRPWLKIDVIVVVIDCCGCRLWVILELLMVFLVFVVVIVMLVAVKIKMLISRFASVNCIKMFEIFFPNILITT